MTHRSYLLKRLFDLCLALLLAPFILALMIVIAIAVKINSKGPVLHISNRVGRDKKNFRMLKVRTMEVDTPQVATHLMDNPGSHVTSVGRVLRKTSLDEIPQLFNIINNDMSFVGPRPALFNQDDLVALREAKGVNSLVPGLTGWAQVTGRDELPIPEKVEKDAYYLKNQSFWFDIYIMWLTLKNALRFKGISH